MDFLHRCATPQGFGERPKPPWSRCVDLCPELPLAGFALGLLLASLSSSPDIWVRGDGRLFALKGPDGQLYLSSRRTGRFEAEIWQRRAGLQAAASFPVNGAVLGGALRCDVIGCVYRQAAGPLVAFVVDPRGLVED